MTALRYLYFIRLLCMWKSVQSNEIKVYSISEALPPPCVTRENGTTCDFTNSQDDVHIVFAKRNKTRKNFKYLIKGVSYVTINATDPQTMETIELENVNNVNYETCGSKTTLVLRNCSARKISKQLKNLHLSNSKAKCIEIKADEVDLINSIVSKLNITLKESKSTFTNSTIHHLDYIHVAKKARFSMHSTIIDNLEEATLWSRKQMDFKNITIGNVGAKRILLNSKMVVTDSVVKSYEKSVIKMRNNASISIHNTEIGSAKYNLNLVATGDFLWPDVIPWSLQDTLLVVFGSFTAFQSIIMIIIIFYFRRRAVYADGPKDNQFNTYTTNPKSRQSVASLGADSEDIYENFPENEEKLTTHQKGLPDCEIYSVSPPENEVNEFYSVSPIGQEINEIYTVSPRDNEEVNGTVHGGVRDSEIYCDVNELDLMTNQNYGRKLSEEIYCTTDEISKTMISGVPSQSPNQPTVHKRNSQDRRVKKLPKWPPEAH